MFRLFRNARFSKIRMQNFNKYFLYAVGEITLVVIGILIAIQVNQWNEARINDIQEQRYLNDLMQDLTQDSTNLAELASEFGEGVRAKRIIEAYLNHPIGILDSASYYILTQWNVSHDFVAQSTTIEELKSSSQLDLISSNELRRSLVEQYNMYEQLSQKLSLGNEKTQELIDIISRKAKNIEALTENEAMKLLNDSYYINKVRLNYYYTQYNWCLQSLKNCSEILDLLREELKQR